MRAPESIMFYAKMLADYVQTEVGAYEVQCANEAVAMVERHTTGVDQIPADPFNRAALEVAAELWNRRGAPNGIKSFGDVDGAVTYRIARDPMVAARPFLSPYLPLAFS